MKVYLTVDEAKSIIRLIKSEDEESVFVGLYLLTGKTFKVTRRLKPCIENARMLLIEMKRYYRYGTDINYYKNELLNSLDKYIHATDKYLRKGHAGN